MFQVHGNALVKPNPGVAMPRNGKVIEIIRVTESVLAESLRRANGDPARLAIIDDKTIIVYNSRESRDIARLRITKRPMAAGRGKRP